MRKWIVGGVVAAVLALGGTTAALAATSSAPFNGSNELTGTVYVCVQQSNESHQYVELGTPAPGNCASGYLQYTANEAPSVTPTPTATVTEQAAPGNYNDGDNNTATTWTITDNGNVWTCHYNPDYDGVSTVTAYPSPMHTAQTITNPYVTCTLPADH
jgi:hypothetical protein